MLKKLLPFALTLFVIITDQVSKFYIVKNWSITEEMSKTNQGVFIKDVFNNGLLEIIHVRNNAVAFSIGSFLPDNMRRILFVITPIMALFLIAFYYFKTNQLTYLQRWALAGVIGGGAGNIIDRIYPKGGVKGVVDFISVKFWGIFGLERWPTFNIADSAVVISVIVLFLTIIPTLNPRGQKA